MATFNMGEGTYAVPMSLHAENRRKLVARFGGSTRGMAVVAGGVQLTRNATDHEPLFRQESFFHYLFGAREPGFYGAVDLSTGESIMFIPRMDAQWAVWMGRIEPPETFRVHYEVDAVYFVDEIATVLKARNLPLFLLRGPNSDSGEEHQPAHFAGIETFECDYTRLYWELCECRVVKTAAELSLMRHVNAVSSRAHVAVMQHARAGLKEYQLEATFLHHCYYHGGCRFASYACICGVGDHAAVLHYGHGGAPNDGPLRDGDMALLDMGAEYHCYASDITCSFPVNGKFTERQAGIYSIVLASMRAVLAAMRPGVSWGDMHGISVRVIAEGLIALGLIKCDLDTALEAGLPALFMPHGLGHFMGIDTHDVGGYPPGTSRIDRPGFRKLRTTRTLHEGMVLTVEPGIYFIESVLAPALDDPKTAPLLDRERVQSYYGFGGVRLEDDVIVTADGAENMTDVPRDIKDVEEVMAGKQWKFTSKLPTDK